MKYILFILYCLYYVNRFYNNKPMIIIVNYNYVMISVICSTYEALVLNNLVVCTSRANSCLACAYGV